MDFGASADRGVYFDEVGPVAQGSLSACTAGEGVMVDWAPRVLGPPARRTSTSAS